MGVMKVAPTTGAADDDDTDDIMDDVIFRCFSDSNAAIPAATKDEEGDDFCEGGGVAADGIDSNRIVWYGRQRYLD
jgi:hypothetical protein